MSDETEIPIKPPVSVPVAEGETVQPERPAEASGTDSGDSSVSDVASSEDKLED